ncbi:MAG: cupin domain-containing protein [bacterium]|nr:cupin domain-containing protein [bacterium]
MADDKRYLHVTTGTMIPVPGGKQIKEMIGRVHTGTEELSLARMVVPPGWGEPPQTPEFGELTVVLRGRVRVEVDGDQVDVSTGEAIWTPAGVRVHFGNPFDEEAEYYAICLPAFSPELAHRDDDSVIQST